MISYQRHHSATGKLHWDLLVWVAKRSVCSAAEATYLVCTHPVSFLGMWHAFKASVQGLQHFHLVHIVPRSLSQELLLQSSSFFAVTLARELWYTEAQEQSNLAWKSVWDVSHMKKSCNFSFLHWHLPITKAQTGTSSKSVFGIFQAIIWTKEKSPQPVPPWFHLWNFTVKFFLG